MLSYTRECEIHDAYLLLTTGSGLPGKHTFGALLVDVYRELQRVVAKSRTLEDENRALKGELQEYREQLRGQVRKPKPDWNGD